MCFVELEEKRRKLFQDWYSRNQLEKTGSTAPALLRYTRKGICCGDGWKTWEFAWIAVVVSPEATISHKKCFISSLPSNRQNREMKLLRLYYFFFSLLIANKVLITILGTI